MGFKVSQEFPSRFLKGSDIAGKESLVVISGIKKEQVYNPKTNKKEQVLVAYFEGKEKTVLIKKQRANDIKDALNSDDTDDWIGKTVTIYTEKKNTGSGIKDVIRFKGSSTSPNNHEL